jgi:hypothetical protein
MNKPFADFSEKLGVFFTLAAILCGCTTTPAPTAIPAPSNTPSPSAIPSRTNTLTATPVLLQVTPTFTAAADPTRLVSSRDALPTRTSAPTATGTPTPRPNLACVVGPGAVNLRHGPGTGHRIITTLSVNTEISARQQIGDGSWLLVSTKDDTVGWVFAALVRCPGKTSNLPLAPGVLALVPPPAKQIPFTATPSATATTATEPPPPEIPINRWRGEYFDNASLHGQPVLVREDPDLDFNWILGSPDPRIPADNFSVRWTGQFYFFEGGDYRFFANADDGIKLYVDGWRVIDSWETNISVDRFGTFADITVGLHTITVEYFESGGHARVRVWAEKGTLTSASWLGEYFDNRTLQDPAKFYRDAGSIDFDWGNGTPDASLDGNHFSVRWKRTLPLEYGNYKFFVETERDDWVRVEIDGWTIIEEYREKAGRIENDFSKMGGGDVTITVEFQEHGGPTRIKFWWEKQ